VRRAIRDGLKVSALEARSPSVTVPLGLVGVRHIHDALMAHGQEDAYLIFALREILLEGSGDDVLLFLVDEER
jgi:hypothetical protein